MDPGIHRALRQSARVRRQHLALREPGVPWVVVALGILGAVFWLAEQPKKARRRQQARVASANLRDDLTSPPTSTQTARRTEFHAKRRRQRAKLIALPMKSFLLHR